jgi:hypothetical protein
MAKRKQLTREYFRRKGRRGGKMAWAKLSAEERSLILSERARKAWETRRAKARPVE